MANCEELIDDISEKLHIDSSNNCSLVNDVDIKENSAETPNEAKQDAAKVTDSKKHPVPSLRTYKEERLREEKVRSVLIYPVVIEDLQNPVLLKYMRRSHQLSIKFDQNDACNKLIESGYIELRLASYEEAKMAAEDLKSVREDLSVHHLDSSRGVAGSLKQILHGLKKAQSEASDIVRESHDQRTVYVGRLPDDVTERHLLMLFNNDVTSFLLPHDDDRKTKGHAYVEFATREKAKAAVESHKELEVENASGPYVSLLIRRDPNPIKINDSTEDNGVMTVLDRQSLHREIASAKRLLRQEKKDCSEGGAGKEDGKIGDLQKNVEVLQERLKKDEDLRREHGLPSLRRKRRPRPVMSRFGHPGIKDNHILNPKTGKAANRFNSARDQGSWGCTYPIDFSSYSMPYTTQYGVGRMNDYPSQHGGRYMGRGQHQPQHGGSNYRYNNARWAYDTNQNRNRDHMTPSYFGGYGGAPASYYGQQTYGPKYAQHYGNYYNTRVLYSNGMGGEMGDRKKGNKNKKKRVAEGKGDEELPTVESGETVAAIGIGDGGETIGIVAESS